jgi:pilus assembly protein TadC
MSRGAARRATRRAPRVDDVDALADLAEVLRVALGAGLTVPAAVALVAPRLPTSVGAAFAAAVDGSEHRSPADALASLPDLLGDPSRELCTALAGAIRYGTPVLPALERVAFELRLSRRLAAETRARRVSVLLLLPLVGCVLPAFVLLAVVPLAIGAMSALPGVTP